MAYLEDGANIRLTVITLAFHAIKCSSNYTVNACFAKLGTEYMRIGKTVLNRRTDRRRKVRASSPDFIGRAGAAATGIKNASRIRDVGD
jgi:hypothetical protein